MFALRHRFKFIKKIACKLNAADYLIVYKETIYSFTKEIFVVTR